LFRAVLMSYQRAPNGVPGVARRPAVFRGGQVAQIKKSLQNGGKAHSGCFGLFRVSAFILPTARNCKKKKMRAAGVWEEHPWQYPSSGSQIHSLRQKVQNWVLACGGFSLPIPGCRQNESTHSKQPEIAKQALCALYMLALARFKAPLQGALSGPA